MLDKDSLRVERILINHGIKNNSIVSEELFMRWADGTSPGVIKRLLNSACIDGLLEITKYNGSRKHYKTVGIRTSIQLKDAQVGTEFEYNGRTLIKIMYDVVYDMSECYRESADDKMLCMMIEPTAIYPGRAATIRRMD